MHQLTDRARSRSRDTQATSTSTPQPPHHIVEFVVSEDGLTYVAPPYIVEVPVISYMAPPKETPVVVKPPTAPTELLLVFLNPILPGFHPDPSIVRVGEDFFLTTSSFKYSPGLPICHSKDLINWKLIGHALTRKSQLDLGMVQPGAGIRRSNIALQGWCFLFGDLHVEL